MGPKTKTKAKEEKSLTEEFCIDVRRQLEELRSGDERELEFPVELDNVQRRYIHSLAQQLGLHSKSKGKKGVDRRITISLEKKQVASQQVALNEENVFLYNLKEENPNIHDQISTYFQRFPLSKQENDAVNKLFPPC